MSAEILLRYGCVGVHPSKALGVWQLPPAPGPAALHAPYHRGH